MSFLSSLGFPQPTTPPSEDDPVVAQVRLSDYKQLVEITCDLKILEKELATLREENKYLRQKTKELETNLRYLA